jgi:hypothetical protein
MRKAMRASIPRALVGCAGGAVLVALAWADAAVAQPKPGRASAPAPRASASVAPAPAPSVAKAPRAAIAAVAESIAKQLAPIRGRVLVAAGALASDAGAPRGPQLVAAIVAQLSGRRADGSRTKAEPTTLPSARALVKGDAALVYLTIEIGGGELRVKADVYPVPGTVWARARDPEPAPSLHAFARAPLDAEVRTYLTPIPLVAAHVDRARNFEGDVVALACGDFHGDGVPEILAVSRRRVTTLRLRGGRVSPIVSRSWPDLAKVNPAPLREPLAFATVAARDGTPFLDVGLTDRASSVRLDGDLKLTDLLPGVALPDGDGTACARGGNVVVTGPVAPCARGDGATYAATVGGKYDAFASARVVSPRGDAFVVWVGREADKLELRDDAGRKLFFDDVGAQLAVGDLDQDGDPEVISTIDTQNPFEDAVVVRSWSRAQPGKLRDVMRIPAAAGVRALAVCPPDGPGRAPFVVATTDEIWVVR